MHPSLTHPHPPYFIQDPELEDGELHSGNARHSHFIHTKDEHGFRRQEPGIYTGNHNMNNVQFRSPNFTPIRQDFWSQNNRETPREDHQPVMTGPSYCHLSYYGEEVDKEFLPEVKHGYSYGKPHQAQYTPRPKPGHPHYGIGYGSQQGMRRGYPVPSSFPQHHHNQQQFSMNHSEIPRETEGIEEEPREYNGFITPTNHRQPYAHTKQERGIHYNNFSIKQDVRKNDDNVNEMNISAPTPVHSFAKAASCFQERQANYTAEVTTAPTASGATYHQGWSGVTASPTIKRKVVLNNKDDDKTKLLKRLNRFGEPIEVITSHRRKHDEASSDEIIKNKKSKREQKRPERRISPIPNSSPAPPTKLPATSMWLSGDGKSFSVTDSPCKRETSNSYVRENGFHNEYNGNRNPEPFQQKRHNQYHSRRGRRQSKEWNNERFHRNASPTVRQEWKPRGIRYRPVVIDGSNVAFTYGEDLHFDCEGIRLCVDYFVQMGCEDVTVVVPKDRLKQGACKFVHILQELRDRKMLMVNWDGEFGDNGNDRDDRLFILDVARSKDAIIISNLSFKDVARYNPGLRQSIWNRVVHFQFNSANQGQIEFPDIDASGSFGPTWDDILHA